jgi:hypothetical protein
MHYKGQSTNALFAALAKSKFRSSFSLGAKESKYLQDKGMTTIQDHARNFIIERLAPAYPENDGRQTPMKNHPVFIAQHATATCCRKCLQKWHGIEMGRTLSSEEVNYIIAVITAWLENQQDQT